MRVTDTRTGNVLTSDNDFIIAQWNSQGNRYQIVEDEQPEAKQRRGRKPRADEPDEKG